MLRVDAEGRDTGEPIVFSEWNMVTGNLIKRRDYRLDALMGEVNASSAGSRQLTMFDAGASATDGLQIDPETNRYIPKPLAEYPLTEYWRVQAV